MVGFNVAYDEWALYHFDFARWEATNHERRMSMLRKFRKGEKGFTLIELLIVVAIIGILAAIAIPQFSSYRQKAYNSAAQADVKNAKTALESAFADNQAYPY
jgi:prepilin-type N-terminal cleavage/methylation domain-containing protein